MGQVIESKENEIRNGSIYHMDKVLAEGWPCFVVIVAAGGVVSGIDEWATSMIGKIVATSGSPESLSIFGKGDDSWRSSGIFSVSDWIVSVSLGWSR